MRSEIFLIVLTLNLCIRQHISNDTAPDQAPKEDKKALSKIYTQSHTTASHKVYLYTVHNVMYLSTLLEKCEFNYIFIIAVIGKGAVVLESIILRGVSIFLLLRLCLMLICNVKTKPRLYAAVNERVVLSLHFHA